MIWPALALLGYTAATLCLGVRIGRRTIKPITKIDLILAHRALRKQGE